MKALGLACLLLIVAVSAGAQTIAHAGDRVAWDYADAELAGIATFLVCETVGNTPCTQTPPAAVRYVPAGTVGDPLPAAGFASYAFPLPATTPPGPYSVTVQACTTAGVCSAALVIPFTFELPAPAVPVKGRIIRSNP